MTEKVKSKLSADKIKEYLIKNLHGWLPFTIIIIAAVVLSAPFAAKWLIVNNDYASGGVNTMGNTLGNISNNGIVCRQGDWIYYRNDDDNRTLYRCRTDGTMAQQIVDDPGVSNINVIGEWIYYRYRGIYKIRVDGEGRMELTGDESAYLNVVGDWIYFANFSDNCYIYKIKTDGTHLTKIANINGEGVNVSDGYMYLNDRDNTKNLYKLSIDAPDASSAVPIVNNVGVFNVCGDWIYYTDLNDNGAICKIKTDGTQQTKILAVSARVLLVDNGKIYYIDSANSEYLYFANTDGTDKRLLAETDCMSINVESNVLMYTRISEGFKAPIHKIFLNEGSGTPVA